MGNAMRFGAVLLFALLSSAVCLSPPTLRTPFLSTPSVGAEYDTPLTRVLVNELQVQCSGLNAAYARGALLKRDDPLSVSDRDLRFRAQNSTYCITRILAAFTGKCRHAVDHYQSQLQAAGTQPTPQMEDRVKQAEGRLRHCVTITPTPKSQSVLWYFKGEPSGEMTEAQRMDATRKALREYWVSK
jgi:hypothetical protein